MSQPSVLLLLHLVHLDGVLVEFVHDEGLRVGTPLDECGMVEFYVHSERLQLFLGQVSGVPQDNGAVCKQEKLQMFKKENK